MCRWVVYLTSVGQEEILLADLVTRPVNSIIHQSRHDPYLPYITGCPQEISARNHGINGDGFGVGWYVFSESTIPCVFTSTQPSWNDRNLQRLANYVRSHCIFAHVRAVAHFKDLRYLILKAIHKTSAHYIEGTTDSEHVFALFVHYLPNHDPSADHNGHVLKKAMLRTIRHVIALVEKVEAKNGWEHVPSSLNFSVTNGNVVIATRFRDCKNQDPPSLYYSEVYKFHPPNKTDTPCHKAKTTTTSSSLSSSSPSPSPSSSSSSSSTSSSNPTRRLQRESSCASNEMRWQGPLKGDQVAPGEVQSVVIASEPLTRDELQWKLVPKNSLLVVTHTKKTIVEPISLLPSSTSMTSLSIVAKEEKEKKQKEMTGEKEKANLTEDVGEEAEQLQNAESYKKNESKTGEKISEVETEKNERRQMRSALWTDLRLGFMVGLLLAVALVFWLQAATLPSLLQSTFSP
ncbi:glutamine amidotransferase subunit [Balamuthia mandrillaris]